MACPIEYDKLECILSRSPIAFGVAAGVSDLIERPGRGRGCLWPL